MSIVDKIMDLVSPSDETVFLEGHDPKNRKVQAIKTGKKYSVTIDEHIIECNSKKDAELEFEFRINDSNKNL